MSKIHKLIPSKREIVLKLKIGQVEKSYDSLGISISINPFLANGPILYPLKTPENLWCY